MTLMLIFGVTAVIIIGLISVITYVVNKCEIEEMKQDEYDNRY